jgi:hypothetical protein
LSEEIENFPGVFPGTIKESLDLAALVQTADVVVQGKVIQTSEAERIQYLVWDKPAWFSPTVALFEVEQSYKGSVETGRIEIDFLQADLPSSLEGLKKGERVVVFLKKKDTRYEFASLTTSKTSVTRWKNWWRKHKDD